MRRQPTLGMSDSRTSDPPGPVHRSSPYAGAPWSALVIVLATAALVLTADRMPLAAWLAASAAAAAAFVAWWQRRMRADRAAAAERDAMAARIDALERRARQLDEAEQLVSLASYDWFPPTGELHWSEQHFRQWGWAPGAVQPTLAIFEQGIHPDDRPRVAAEMQRALRGETHYDCRYRVRRADGSEIHVRARGRVFFDAQGRPERMIGAVLDITDRVQAEAQQRLFQFVLDAITDPVSVVDADRRYRLANKAWYRETGIAGNRPMGMHFDHVFPVVASDERREALAACLTDDRVHTVRSASPAAPRSGRVLETRYFPFSDSGVDWRGVVMVSRDVTEDEAVRAELAASVATLRLTLNTIGEAVFATDAEGPDEPVLFFNDRLIELWRIPPGSTRPLTARTIMDCARRYLVDAETEVARIQAIVAGNLHAEDVLRLNDGRVLIRRCRPAEREPRPVRVWCFRDITAEVRGRDDGAGIEPPRPPST